MARMVTIHRQFGFRFAIHTDDHEPAHVHVIGDGEMKVVIRGADGLPEQVYATGFKTRDRRRAMDVVLERQEEFLARWAEIQGSRSE
jgi:histidinol phosphatase-like PHP family hydrolase